VSFVFALDVFLSYLETHRKDGVVHPWVRVTYLFLGTALDTSAFQ
jgi:hypothetical protein